MFCNWSRNYKTFTVKEQIFLIIKKNQNNKINRQCMLCVYACVCLDCVLSPLLKLNSVFECSCLLPLWKLACHYLTHTRTKVQDQQPFISVRAIVPFLLFLYFCICVCWWQCNCTDRGIWPLMPQSYTLKDPLLTGKLSHSHTQPCSTTIELQTWKCVFVCVQWPFCEECLNAGIRCLSPHGDKKLSLYLYFYY